MCYMIKTGRWLQSVQSETEMEGRGVLDTVWLREKCFTQGGGWFQSLSTQESITGGFS